MLAGQRCSVLSRLVVGRNFSVVGVRLGRRKSRAELGRESSESWVLRGLSSRQRSAFSGGKLLMIKTSLVITMRLQARGVRLNRCWVVTEYQ